MMKQGSYSQMWTKYSTIYIGIIFSHSLLSGNDVERREREDKWSDECYMLEWEEIDK